MSRKVSVDGTMTKQIDSRTEEYFLRTSVLFKSPDVIVKKKVSDNHEILQSLKIITYYIFWEMSQNLCA